MDPRFYCLSMLVQEYARRKWHSSRTVRFLQALAQENNQ